MTGWASADPGVGIGAVAALRAEMVGMADALPSADCCDDPDCPPDCGC
ncbi:hypothetical protein [Dactylosporangium sp. NPDC048998]